MKAHRQPAIDRVLAPPEDPAALLVQQPALDELVDEAAGLEAGIELDQGLRPQRPGGQLRLAAVLDPGVADLEKRPRVVLVVADQLVAHPEDVHRVSGTLAPRGRKLARSRGASRPPPQR